MRILDAIAIFFLMLPPLAALMADPLLTALESHLDALKKRAANSTRLPPVDAVPQPIIDTTTNHHATYNPETYAISKMPILR